MNGWTICCPFCARPVLPADASLHYAVMPRLVWHMLDRHPYEATVLRLRLVNPPTEWPVIEEAPA